MAVFDIGSSSIGGALFWTEKSGVPKIVFSAREPIIIENEINVNKFLSLTVKSLQIIADKMYKAKIGAPKKIFCVLSSPWHVSQTRVISLRKNTPFIFNSKLADELIKKEISIFEDEYKGQYEGISGAARSIELKNIRTTLNGYDTIDPLSQKAKELEMTIFVSISPEQVLSKIEKVISKYFHLEAFGGIKFSSFVMASFSTVRDIYTHQENFLLIDIGGEMTDISMIKKNILRESVSFPLGCNFIIREAASALSCTFAEAESLISLFQDRHAELKTAKKLEPIVSQLKKKWLEKFQQSLANISNDISIPADIYITVPKDLEDFFTQMIKTEQFNQYTLTESKFQVTFLGTDVFHDFAEFGEGVARDSGLIIDSIYINRFFQKTKQ